MREIVSVATMRESDAATIESGVSGRELMWRAGLGIFQSHAWQGPVAIVCGNGNNAGDGYVLALLLQEAGIACKLFLLEDQFSSDGAYYYGKCKENGVLTGFCNSKTDFSGYAEIVDCIFGTGFRGSITGLVADVIEKINQSSAFVVSADINSGLCGDNGLSECCVRSDLTVSIGLLKYGQLLGQAKDKIGRLVCIDIGIRCVGATCFLAEASDFAGILKERRQDSHKGSYGYVAILGGSTEYAGAVKLANLSASALRSGCGVAKLVVPQSLASSVSPYLLESTLALLPERDGKLLFDPEALDRALAGQKALAVGMGWGRSPEYAKILEHLLLQHALPLVIDADGLNTLSETDLSILKKTDCRAILTPHLKEMERLSGKSMEEIRRDPIGVAQAFAAEYGVILLLKGPCSVVTDGKTTYLVDRGCAGMATAGSGDVLSGVLAGLLGFSEPEVLTVACGAYLAGLAGELAERDTNPISMLASDTVAHLFEAVSAVLHSNQNA